MNKKEISEIKKNFKSESDRFVMHRVLTGFINADKTLMYHNTTSCITMPIENVEIYDKTLRRVLNTKVGKNFTEYEFPTEAYETETGVQTLLYQLLQSELKQSELNKKYLEYIAENIDYTQPFTVITAYCTYSVPKKNKNDETDDFNHEEYNYLLTAICPAESDTDGLIYVSSDNAIQIKSDTDLIISKVPTDGFLFPTFSDRQSDINHVMYYTKSKEPNVSIIENVLMCTYTMSAQDEKETFHNILTSIAGEQLDYTLINSVNESIKFIVENNKNETENVTLEPHTLKEILIDTGLSEERIDMVTPVYEKLCGKTTLTASNLIDNKTTIDVSGITVNIKPTETERIRTSNIDGRKCIIIDIDSPVIDINGYPVDMS